MMILFGLTLVVLTLKFVYAACFKFKTPFLEQPVSYIQAAAILNVASTFLLFATMIAFFFRGEWGRAVTLFVVIAVSEQIMRSFCYQRAVKRLVAKLTSVEPENRESVASFMIDMEIKERRRL